MTVILALGNLMMEDGKHEANLCYVARPGLQTNTKTKHKSHYTKPTEISLNSLQYMSSKGYY